MRTVIALAASLCLSAGLAEAAGVQRIAVSTGDGSGTLEGAVWSPCAEPSDVITLGRIEVPGVRDCPVDGTALPLVVISHGARGWLGGHHDTAAALADAGYVVAAITHPDREGRAWRTDRPAAIRLLIDHMLETWPDHGRLDADRIGFFGFSRGGYTGLVLIGGTPDFSLAARHCRAVPDDPLCRLPGGGPASGQGAAAAPGQPFTRDPRIGAAVIAAPLGLVFSAEGLRDVTVPVQLWRPEQDELATHPYNAEAVYQALPVAPEYHVVPNAGHFAILAPCTGPQAQAVPEICADPPGFDRVAFHTRFNAVILTFFETHLNGP